MGQYGIHRVEKVKGGGIGGIEREATREQEYPGSTIDQTRTADNCVLLDTTAGQRWQSYVGQQIQKTGCRVRKDSVKAITAIYTASPDYMAGLTREQQMDFFRDCLAWHEKTYGKAFYAIVHMDEATPHMHVTGIPLQERDGKTVLSAKTCLGGRRELAEKQERFYREICEPRGLDHHHVREPHQQRQHLDSIEYKIQQEEQRLRDQLERLLPEPEPGKDMVEYRRSIVDRLLGKDTVTISREAFDQLQRQAAMAEPLAQDRDKALQQSQRVTRERDRIYREATEAAERRLEQLRAEEQKLDQLLRKKAHTEPLETLEVLYDLVDTATYEDARPDRLSQRVERERCRRSIDQALSDALESILGDLRERSLDTQTKAILEDLRTSRKGSQTHQRSRSRGLSR